MASVSYIGNAPFRDGWRALLPLGLRLHPLAGKRPVLADWVNQASNDPAVLEVWEASYGQYNIGIVLGYVPEHDRTYLVLDLDLNDEGVHGADSLNEYRLARGLPTLPSTLVQITGGGGSQVFLYVPGNWQIDNYVAKLPGVDVRAVGGQVAAPPSIHPDTHVTYYWHDPTIPIAPAPDWVVELVGYRAPGERKPSGKADPAVDGAPIPDHERNTTLTSICGRLRNLGMTRNAMLGQLNDINENRCQPPLPFEELEWIVDSISKKPAGPPDMPNWPRPEDAYPPPPGDDTVDDDLLRYGARDTDRYNGDEFAVLNASKLIYTAQAGWFAWDGCRWKRDTLLVHQKLVGDLANGLWERMVTHPEEKDTLWKRIKRLESASGMRNALTFAESRMARDISSFDTDPWLINFTNGTLDLRTFELRAFDPNDLITRMCSVPYVPDAVDEVWESFLLIALEDDDMRHTFHAFMGSCLTGETRDKSVLLPEGGTDTGKSTAVEPCFNVLGKVDDGGYAATWNAEVVERGKTANLDEKKAQARGARLIVVGELTRGSKFNDGFLKQFSGGDTVSARSLYKDSFSYRPQAKLVMHTNFVPTSADRATQNRLKLLPFKHKFVPRDESIRRYLETNPDAQIAIAAWLVRGCYLWQTEGLGKMPWLDDIMHAYDLDSNPVAAFVEEALEMTEIEEESIRPEEMWQLYIGYESSRGGRPYHRRTFERALGERGLERKRVPRKGGTMRWVGWRAKVVEVPYGV